jgi:hypothetical protein
MGLANLERNHRREKKIRDSEGINTGYMLRHVEVLER